MKKRCWQVRYYFRVGSRRRLYKGEYCGCLPGETKADVLQSVDVRVGDRTEDGHEIVKVTATPPRKGHYCFTNNEEVVA